MFIKRSIKFNRHLKQTTSSLKKPLPKKLLSKSCMYKVRRYFMRALLINLTASTFYDPRSELESYTGNRDGQSGAGTGPKNGWSHSYLTGTLFYLRHLDRCPDLVRF